MKGFILLLLIIAVVLCTKTITTVDMLPQQKPEQETDVAMILPEEKPEPVKVGIKKLSLVTVYFDFDSDVLKDGERWKLSNINEPVELTGGSCPIGDSQHNYTLGIKRAIVVKNYFENKGVKAKSYKSVGEGCLVTEYRKDFNLNRRCEVRY